MNLPAPEPTVGELLLLLQDPRVRYLRRESLWVGFVLGTPVGAFAAWAAWTAFRVVCP